MFCVCSCNFRDSVMAKYYKEIFQLLALGEESFEDVLQRDFSTVGIRRGVF